MTTLNYSQKMKALSYSHETQKQKVFAETGSYVRNLSQAPRQKYPKDKSLFQISLPRMVKHIQSLFRRQQRQCRVTKLYGQLQNSKKY